MNRMLAGAPASLALAALITLGGTAAAVDGVFEINNASVMAAGGYPAIVATPGSYVLTGNLTPPVGVDGIQIGTADVTIDLNGFNITSPGGGAASGILAAGISNVTVRNGSIAGFGGVAINAGPQATVMGTRLTGNAGGIGGVYDCLIVENVISLNGGSAGIQAFRCKIENNVVTDNGGAGIVAEFDVIVHNQITNNVGGGILTAGGSTIQQNVLTFNQGFGISDGTPFPPAPLPGPVPPPPAVPSRDVIESNTISNTVAGAGIALSLPAVITRNTITGNFADGVICGADCLIFGNDIDSNNVGGAGGGGVTAYAGSAVNHNSIGDNLGYGLGVPVMAGFTNNTFSNNGPGIDVLVLGGGPHPTAGFFNLCSGIPGPSPTCP